jgi:hypothetical protein
MSKSRTCQHNPQKNPNQKMYATQDKSLAKLLLPVAQLHDSFHSPAEQLEKPKLSTGKKPEYVENSVVRKS